MGVSFFVFFFVGSEEVFASVLRGHDERRRGDVRWVDACTRERDVHGRRVQPFVPGLAAGHPGQRLLQTERLLREYRCWEGLAAVAEAQGRATRGETRRGDVEKGVA